MKKSSTVGMTKMGAVVGLDLSDRKATYVILNWRGRVVAEGSIALTRRGLEDRFAHATYRVALEAGTHSPWVSRVLQQLGHEVLVANPRQLPLIFRSLRKDDRMDALSLARLARFDPLLLRPITHRSEEAQHHLALLRARDALVASRTSLISHVRGVVKSAGGRLPSCSAPSFARQAADLIPEPLAAALQPLLQTVAQLSDTISQYDREVERLAAQHYPVTTALRQVNGVGPLTALAFVLTIEDPARFRTSRDVGAYVGLTPHSWCSAPITSWGRLARTAS